MKNKNLTGVHVWKSITCPDCWTKYRLSNKIIKSGKTWWIQRYKCKDCMRFFTELSEWKIMRSYKYRQALHLYIEGVSLRKIATFCDVSNVTILNWMKNIGATELKLETIKPAKILTSNEIERNKGFIDRTISQKHGEDGYEWIFLRLSNPSFIVIPHQE